TACPTASGSDPTSLPVINPHRRAPRQLAVDLLDADVVEVHTARRSRVGPGAGVLRLAGGERRRDAAVLHDGDAGDRAGAGDRHLQRRRVAGFELVAHDVHAATDVEQDVVGRAVAVPLLEGVEDRRAVVAFGQRDAVGDVRGPVVARRLEAEAVALVAQGAVDEAQRPPAGDVGRLLAGLRVVAGPRGALLLVGHAVALVDLDDRL